MLRRFAFGFLGVAAAATVVAGCASGGATQTVAVGPSFAPQTVYATNSTQNGISIYTGTSGGPSYQISTGNATNGLSGPQYLAFDSSSNIWVTNFPADTTIGSLVEIKAAATGTVVPYNSFNFQSAVHPRGIADFKINLLGQTTAQDGMVVGVTDPTQPLPFASRLLVFLAASLRGVETIGGPNTGLNVPSGIAVDKNNNIYVTNLQGPSGNPSSSAGSVEVFNIPSPSPTPSPTATPSPTPSPTATPTGATATPSPTPAPTQTPVNIAPTNTIAGTATGINQPTGIAIDASGNIYVSDQASTICGPTKCPAILIFTAGATGNATPAFIAGSATKLFAPTDVKVDSSGKIYVADSTAAGAGVIYVFASGSTGNVAPTSTFTSPGSVIGLGLAP